MSKAITASQILNILEQQQYYCPLSGRKLNPETASVDHIVPLAKGGTHDITNIWVVDHKVNIAKGTMSVDEFVKMCKDVAKHYDGCKTVSISHNNPQTQDALVPLQKMLF